MRQQALTLDTLRTLSFPAARLRDGSSVFSNFQPYSNSTENIGRYQFTPGQVTG